MLSRRRREEADRLSALHRRAGGVHRQPLTGRCSPPHNLMPFCTAVARRCYPTVPDAALVKALARFPQARSEQNQSFLLVAA